MFCLLVAFIMIYGLGHWIWKVHQRLRTKEEEAAQEHAELRKVAETAASDAASCVAVIDKFGTPPKRRHMRAVRDENTGVSTWDWK